MNRFLKYAVMITAMTAAAAFAACDDDDDNNGGGQPPVEKPYAGEYSGTYVCSAPGQDGNYNQIAQEAIAFKAEESSINIPDFPLSKLVEVLNQQGVIPAEVLPMIQAVKVSYALGIGTVTEENGVYTAPTSTPVLTIADKITVNLSSPAPMTYTAAGSEMKFHLVINTVTVGDKEPMQLGFKFDITGKKK